MMGFSDEPLPEVSVIVVCYNEMRFLRDCLEPLLRQDYSGSYEIIVVDNGSTDGSRDFVRESFPDVRLIDAGKNLGFAKGNNFGAQFAHGEILAFLNSDTKVLGSEWLSELVHPFLTDPTIGLTTSKIVLMEQPDVINACGLDVSLTGIATCRYAGLRSSAVVEDEEVAAVSGGAFAIRTSLFAQLGGFDQHIWIYQEDTDLSWRARLAGYRCVLAAKSVVSHSYTFKLPPHKVRDIERTRYLMLAKNLSPATLLTLVPLLFLTELLTWGWAMLQGPKYMVAKAEAMWWSIEHIHNFVQAHRETQRLRRVPDAVVLRHHLTTPAVETVSPGIIGRLAGALLTPVSVALGSAALRLVADRGQSG